MISSIAWLPAAAVKPIPRSKPLTEDEIAEARRIAAEGETDKGKKQMATAAASLKEFQFRLSLAQT